MTLDNNGAIDGVPGSTVGWGVTVSWTSDSGDWLTFGTTHLTGQTAPAVSSGYSDLTGINGGPINYAVAPDSTWYQPCIQGTTGAGDYQIAANAIPGDQDTGQLVFSFEVLSGEPGLDSPVTVLGDGIYSFATGYSVTVDTPQPGSGAPEPAAWILLLSGASTIWLIRAIRGCLLSNSPES